MKIYIGFLLLGLVVGDMAGLSSESLVSKLIALLFALFGGSIVILFQKFTQEERQQMGTLIGALCVGMLIGLHVGIITSQYRLLSPKDSVQKSGDTYLKRKGLPAIASIDSQLSAGVIDSQEAYKELKEIVKDGSQ